MTTGSSDTKNGGKQEGRLQELLIRQSGFDPDLPLARAKTIPNHWYWDEEIYELEKAKIFANSWQWIAREEELPKPGSFLTTERAGEPILLIADENRMVRAFYNICRHRAAPLLSSACGEVNKLRCRYHGWTYDLHGALRGVPEFDGVEDFCRESSGLVEIPLDRWGNWCWIHQGQANSTLKDYLSPLPEWSLPRNWDNLRFCKRVAYDLNCNWKVYVDNYLDGGYHVNTVHPGLAGVINYSEYNTTIYSHTSLQSSPLKSSTSQKDGDRDNAGDDVDNKAVQQTRIGDLAAYWWVYPNFMINWYQGVLDTNLVLPLGPEKCRVVFDFYFDRSGLASTEDFQNRSIQVAEQIQDEDIQICHEVQRNLHSRHYSTGRFSVRREIAGYHFHQLLGRALLNQE